MRAGGAEWLVVACGGGGGVVRDGDQEQRQHSSTGGFGQRAASKVGLSTPAAAREGAEAVISCRRSLRLRQWQTRPTAAVRLPSDAPGCADNGSGRCGPHKGVRAWRIRPSPPPRPSVATGDREVNPRAHPTPRGEG